jgi:hypothetical protein
LLLFIVARIFSYADYLVDDLLATVHINTEHRQQVSHIVEQKTRFAAWQRRIPRQSCVQAILSRALCIARSPSHMQYLAFSESGLRRLICEHMHTYMHYDPHSHVHTRLPTYVRVYDR